MTCLEKERIYSFQESEVISRISKFHNFDNLRSKSPGFFFLVCKSNITSIVVCYGKRTIHLFFGPEKNNILICFLKKKKN